MILNYDHYRAGSRKRRLRIALIPALSAALVLAIVLIIALRIPSRVFPATGSRQNVSTLQGLWREENYGELVHVADAILSNDPLNPSALAYRGFAQFYRAASENSSDERAPILDEAIVSLRRAKLVATAFAGEADYVLGKSYFHKGKYYYDLAILYMESSLAKGFLQRDSHEYIGLAYTQLGDLEKGMRHFLEALKEDASDLLLLTIGQTYYQMKRAGDAIDYLLRTLNKTEDTAIEKRARFLLGEIYFDRSELFKAEEQYGAIVKIDQQSADAHFVLGEVYAKMNDTVKARAEWRNALIIDPSHYGAKLRYYAR